jgi:hypothetical protein
MKKIIVHNYNSDLNWLKLTYDHGFSKENIIIYQKISDNESDWSHIGKVFKSPNVGANQYEILRFIIDNYDNLPDNSIFIKGNILFHEHIKGVDNYTNLERFVESLYSDTFFSIWQDKLLLSGDKRHCHYTSEEILRNGILNQPIEHTYDSRVEYKYFSSIYSILDWLFEDCPRPSSMPFVPASIFSVPKEMIYIRSKIFYERLLSIMTYQPKFYMDWAKYVCGECFLIERLFPYIWENSLKERGVIENVIQN